MTKEQITSGNILIARFLGWELSPNARRFKIEDRYPYGYVKAHPDSLFFDQSLDWLYPVLEKISDIECVADIQITPCVTNIYADKTFTHFGDFLTAPWGCAVDFIKWYNTLNNE